MTQPVATSNLRPAAWSSRLGSVVDFCSQRPRRLGLLLLACLIPRVVVAWRLPAVCDDGFSYLHIADCIERGRITEALEYLNLNIYPLLLMGLHRLGLEWTVAGKVLGIVMGTAIALPLFDWLRRMFDEEKATLGVLLYAVHPKFIEYSVEPIREATFWFLFVLGLDCLWRCMNERRWWQFAASGVCLALALHTRVEGWFLLAPLAVWGAVSWWRTPAARMRIAVGVLLSLTITPLFILALNLTVLAHYPKWELGRLSPLAVAADWFRARPPAKAPQPAPSPVTTAPAVAATVAVTPTPANTVAASQATTAPGAASAAVQSIAPVALRHQTASYLRDYSWEFVRTVGIPFVVLTLIGLFGSLRMFRDVRVGLLLVLSVATLLAIWIQLVHAGNMNGRYFLTLGLLNAGFTATGCLMVMRWLHQAVSRRGAVGAQAIVVAGLLPACLLAAGWIQAFSSHHSSRQREARLGRWARTHTIPIRRAVADYQSLRPAYFATGRLPDVVKYDSFFNKEFDQNPPDLLVIDPQSFAPRLLPLFLERATDLGLTRLDQQEFSSTPSKFEIYVRLPKVEQAAVTASQSQPSAVIQPASAVQPTSAIQPALAIQAAPAVQPTGAVQAELPRSTSAR